MMASEIAQFAVFRGSGKLASKPERVRLGNVGVRAAHCYFAVITGQHPPLLR